MRSNISTEWTRSLPESEKEEFKRLLLSSNYILSKLVTILKDKDNSLTTKETSIEDFQDPNWSHKQAFRNGQRATLKEILTLLSFTKET